MKIKDKRKSGEMLGRDGISQRIIALATEISTGSYKDAITKAGRISVLVDAASYDEYWNEKANIGKNLEECTLENFIAGNITKERLICR